MSRYQLTELARDDLLDIGNRIAEDNGKEVARRILSELRDRFGCLCDFPKMGRPRPDLTHEPVYFFPFYSWLIVYDPEPKPLQVIRIVSSYRSPNNFFPPAPP